MSAVALAPSRPRRKSAQVAEAKITSDSQRFVKQDPIAEFSQALRMVLREWFGDVDMQSLITIDEFSTIAEPSADILIGTYQDIGDDFPLPHMQFHGFRVKGSVSAAIPAEALAGSLVHRTLAEANQTEVWRTVHLKIHLTDGVPTVTFSTPPFDEFDHSCIEHPEQFAAWRAQSQKAGAELAEVA